MNDRFYRVSIVLALLLAACFLAFWVYSTMNPKTLSIDGQMFNHNM